MALSDEDKIEIKQIIRKEIHDAYVETYGHIISEIPLGDETRAIASIFLDLGKKKLLERFNTISPTKNIL